MTKHTQLHNSLRFTLMFIATIICFDALAKKPPPGVPKKKDCRNSLIAVKVTDLEFGDFDGSVGGTITVDTSGIRSTTAPFLVGGTVSAAAFDVSNSLAGCDYYPVRIQVLNVPTDLTGPGTPMLSDIYTTSPTGTFTLNSTPGTATRVTVGASLITGNAQTGGAYTTPAPFTMRFSHRNPKK